MNISVNPLTQEAHKIHDKLDDSFGISEFLEKIKKKVIVVQGLGFVGAVMAFHKSKVLSLPYEF